jgi:Rho termination factor, N-terminal domain
VPKNQRDTDPQTPILSAVRESQTAFVDVIRSWTDITGQLTQRSPVPRASIDIAGAVDRAFDLAEQTLAAQRQFALTLVGVIDRRVDSAVEAVEASAHEQPPAATPEALTDQARERDIKQASKPDRRPFEERSVEELRDRARELEIEGRSAMSKDELVAALRAQAK